MSKSDMTSMSGIRILVLCDAPDREDEIRTWFEPAGSVDIVRSFEEALEVLAGSTFDLIVANPTDLIRTQGVHFAREAETILESVTQGICIVAGDGHLIWANPKMLNFPEALREQVSRLCVETLSWAIEETDKRSSHPKGRRFTINTEDHGYFELTITPVIDLDHRITRVAAVVWEATHLKRMREKLDAIDRAGFELARFDTEQIARLDASERLALIEQKIIRCTRDLMHFDNFAIRLVDKETGRLDLVLSAGMPTEAQELTIHASSESNGISGYVAHSGKSYICPDVTQDPRYLAGIPRARSSLTVPLRLHDQVVGIFNIESDRCGAFTEDDRQFAEIFGRHVAMALYVLNLLVTERCTATGRVGSDVMAEIRAPINDILSDIAALKEDYIGLDDLRHRLDRISDNAVAVRESIKAVTSTDTGLVGGKPMGPRTADPVLGGKRVLIADDEDTIRETVRAVLINQGCRVEAAANGQAALDALASGPFDLVLSDIRMPDKDGYQVFAAAKDADPDTPVILMTGFGYDPNHSIVRARREGLAAILFKPFKVEQLLNELRTAIQHASAQSR